MANLFTVIGNFFVKLFSAIFGKDLAASLSSSLVNLAKDAVGKLAIDAVQYVQAALPGSSDADKRAAAVTKLKADLVASGKDLANFGESLLNLLVELGVQYVKKYLPSEDSTTVTDTSENPAPEPTAPIEQTAAAHAATLSSNAEAEAYLRTLPPHVQTAIAQQNLNAKQAAVVNTPETEK